MNGDVRTVSLIMPVFDEAIDLPDVLATILAQDYARDAMYLIVVDGGSTDGSVELVKAWFATNRFAGEVVHNPRRTIPTSLNHGIARARPGDIVVRLDAHTTYEPAYVSTIVASFASLPETIACVGGAQLPAPETAFGRSLVRALYLNPMGLGGASFRRGRTPHLVGAVYLGAWRPGILNALGGYDETWEANEDGELAARLRKQGYQTMWLPLDSAYRVKRGPLAAIKQWGRYGYWRAQTIRRHPDELRVRHMIPPIALIGGIVLALTPWRAAALVAALLYALAVVAKRTRGEAPLVTLATCVFFPACQVAWTVGLLRGALFPATVAARGTAPVRDAIR